MKMGVAVVKSVDEALGFVPLVGKAARDMTEIHLDVKGPVEKPEAHILPAAGLVEGVKTEVKEISKEIKGIFKRGSHHSGKTAE